MLKHNPQRFLKYMYYTQLEISKLNLTKNYDEFIYKLKTVKGTERNGFFVKNPYWKGFCKNPNWKWGFVKKPTFKLMPLNSIKKHFIRIDKKSLSELKIASLYNSNIDTTVLKNIKTENKIAFIKLKTPFKRSLDDNSLFLNKELDISFTLNSFWHLNAIRTSCFHLSNIYI